MITQAATVEQLKEASEKLQQAFAAVCAEEDVAEKRYADLFTKSEKFRKHRKTGRCVAEVQAEMSDAYAALKRIRNERMATYNVMRDTQQAMEAAESAA